MKLLGWITTIFILAILVTIIYFSTQGQKLTGKGPEVTQDQEVVVEDSYKDPFKTGYINNSPQSNANVCGGSIYPIQQPYVNYGETTSCSQCDNITFNSAP